MIFGIEFLWNKLRIRNIAHIVRPENIGYMKDKGIFFLSNWFKLCQPETDRVQPDLLHSSQEDMVTSQDIVLEIKAVAFIILKLKGVRCEKLETMRSSSLFENETNELELKSTIAEVFDDGKLIQHREPLRDLTERMLSLDLQKLPTLEELKGLKNEITKELKTLDSRSPEETNQVRSESQSKAGTKISTRIIGKYYLF